MKKLLFISMISLGAAGLSAQKVMVNDPAHSRIQFSVVHLGLNDITGNFDKAALTINGDEKNFLNSKIVFDVDPASIDTHVDARDTHLKSADFFDVATYPKMSFTSTSIQRVRKDFYNVKGNLTMHGVTKPVTVTLLYRGATVNPMNKKETYGYQVTADLNRADFGIGPKFPDTMVSNEVRIKGDFELSDKK